MINSLKKIYRKLFINAHQELKDKTEPYDFNKSNPLGGDGERVDITYNSTLDFRRLDIYQKSHFKRYEFATDVINTDDVCGDFACGTGYGSVMLSAKASSVVGVDLNDHVISQISDRYKTYSHVEFKSGNLLNLKYENYFDSIVSFETIEHFYESDIIKILQIFYKALKENGKLIFSTPYMQERSEAAEKLGFHFTFYLNEEKIAKMLATCGFEAVLYKFQNYETHNIENNLVKKDFIICIAKKI